MRERLNGWAAERMDRIIASDPGLGRLHMAGSAAASMGTALALEYVLARLIGADSQNTLISMLLGAVVAMMGANALIGTGAWRKTRMAALFPVAIGLGMLLGIAVGQHTDVMLITFVLVMFVAVYIRRFGLPYFFYGFMIWMGYFFASFLQATLDILPTLMLAVAVSSVWVLLLSLTVLRTNPRRSLRRTLRAYDARARAVARAGAELLQTPKEEIRRQARWRRRLAARQAGLAEAALMIEGWSEEPGALPEGWSGPSLRRRLLDSHQLIDRIAGSAVALFDTATDLVPAALAVLEPLARRQDRIAADGARRLADSTRSAEPGWWPARHLAVAALEFLDLAAHADRPPSVEPVDEYTATASLALGNLPGAPSIAGDVPARGTSWNPLARLDLTTRQAIQVAIAGTLAIVIGREVSSTRYYWAVIAAFVAFSGTATRSETFVKATNRVIGTVAGLFASIALANLTAGHTGWVVAVIIAAMFCGFYLIRVSYAYMIFFITIMVGQLYSVLHEFSDGLLVLRLEETALGAVIGIGVSLLVTPLSTRDTVRASRDNLLTALGLLLTALADRMTEPFPEATDRPDLDALARALDNRARELTLVAKPLTRPLVWGNSSPRTRHRLALYLAAVSNARALIAGFRREPPECPESVATACRELAAAAARLIEVAPGKPMPSLAEPLADADTALFHERSADPGDQATGPVLRPLIHLHDVLAELAIAPDAVAETAPA